MRPNKKPVPRLLVFSRKGCSVCHAIEPKLKELFTKYSQLQVEWIDADQNPSRAGEHLVFTVPAVLFLYGKREQFRLVRSFAMAELEAKLEKFLEQI